MSNELILANKPIMEVQDALQMRQALLQYIDGILRPGVDYGTVPGTDKDVLLKPGAEKLASYLGLTPDFIQLDATEDWTGEGHGGEPLFSYRYKCDLYKGDARVGQGIGSCNSWEKKYRWRWVDEGELPANLDPDRLMSRKAQVTEFEFAIEKSETAGKYGKPQEYWDNFKAAIKAGEAIAGSKKTAKGAEFMAWTIESVSYRIPNEDIFSQVNTVDKMAQKRALVAAILVAANVSELFTQDLEDIDISPAPVVVQAEAKAAPSPAKKPDQNKVIDLGNDDKAPPDNGGNPIQGFWAYQRANNIPKDAAQKILAENGNDFGMALDILKEQTENEVPF